MANYLYLRRTFKKSFLKYCKETLSSNIVADGYNEVIELKKKKHEKEAL